MRISFDIHGVIDTQPKLFVEAIKELKKMGHDVIVITGPKLDKVYYTKRNGKFNSVKEELIQHGVHHLLSKVYSILDYHKEIGTEMWENDNGWYIEEDEWNRTKSILCRDLDVDLHIDDTLGYQPYFVTPFGYVNNDNNTLSIYNSEIKLNPILYSIYRDILGYKIKLS
jgi:hypothetical protein